MIRLLLILLLILPSQAFSDAGFIGEVSDSVESGPTYLVDEDFDATETPTGFATLTGTITYDNTTSPINGAQDMLETYSGTTVRATLSFDPDLSTGHTYQFKFKASALPASADAFVTLRNGATGQAYLRLDSDGSFAAYAPGEGPSATASSYVSTGSVYQVRAYYEPSSGSDDGTFTVEIRPDGGSWTSVKTQTNATGTSDIQDAYFEWETTGTLQIDDFQVFEGTW